MGSFSFTCAVSRFPIQGGDPVRFFLLNKNPYGEHVCSIGGNWVPRTLPVTGYYDDYGQVEDITDETAKAVWLAGFQKDLVENGWGDNSCHDLPCRKDMTFDELLEALWERRVQVLRKVPLSFTWDNPELLEGRVYCHKPGVPYFGLVETAIKEAGFPLFEGNATKGYEVYELQHGVIRIRYNDGYSEADDHVVALEKVQSLFPQFASMIAAGTGGYNHGDPDLILRPKAGTPDYHGGREEEEEPLPVSYAMIREDVWQCLLTLTSEDSRSCKIISAKKSIEQNITNITAYVDKYHSSETYRKFLPDSYDAGSWMISKSEIPFTMGLAEHWLLLNKIRRPTEQEIQLAAEMAHIYRVLSLLRYTWQPSNSSGPQYGGWAQQKLYTAALAKIAKKEAATEKAEMEDYE